MNILLDYFFPISAINPTPAASTAFLKQALLVVKPKVGVTPGEIVMATTMSQVQAVTDNNEAQHLFNAGMNRVFLMPVNDLELASFLEGHESDFFTILISSDFDKNDVIASQATLTKAGLTFTAKGVGIEGNDISIEFLDTAGAGAEVVTVAAKKITVSMEDGVSTANQIKAAIDASPAAAALILVVVGSGQGAIAQAAFAEDNLEGGDGLNLGAFKGVVGLVSDDTAFLKAQNAIENRTGFYADPVTGAKNLLFAFGKLLSNALDWTNQQFITMPIADDVDTLGEANALFDDKTSFVISDSQFGNRLALLATGGKAIVAPYIKRNLEIDLQSKALQYVSGNQPSYSKVQASLLEDELQKVVQSYIDRGWITDGVVQVKLEQDNFVASGYINIAEPKALWRIFGEIRQTL